MSILVLGYFGFMTNQLDGQTVKTRQIYDLIKDDEYSDVCYFDTESFKKSKLNILRMFWLCIISKKIIYLPAHNNLKYLFPFIFLFSKLFNNKIYYFVVGGWLDIFIQNKKMHTFFLKKVHKILVETSSLKKKLENIGFGNVGIFTNFRFFNDNSYIKTTKKGGVRFVFLSRVQIKKGIDFIIEKAKMSSDFVVDVYGPLTSNIDEKNYILSEFNTLENINYFGGIEPEDIQNTLQNYDVLLLPTHYYTEGLPGAIVDAMISNIPVVVSEWQYSHEFVNQNETGLIFNFDDFEDFSKKVDFLMSCDYVIDLMKKNVSREKYKFSSDNAFILLNKILIN